MILNQTFHTTNFSTVRNGHISEYVMRELLYVTTPLHPSVNTSVMWITLLISCESDWRSCTSCPCPVSLTSIICLSGQHGDCSLLQVWFWGERLHGQRLPVPEPGQRPHVRSSESRNCASSTQIFIDLIKLFCPVSDDQRRCFTFTGCKFTNLKCPESFFAAKN